MNYRCSSSNCSSDVIWECSCPEKLKHCSAHMESHSTEVSCLMRNIRRDILQAQARKIQNDIRITLDYLGTDLVQISEVMINEIKICLRHNQNSISAKKHEVTSLSLENLHEQSNNIIQWANNLKILDRNKNEFSSTVQKLLELDPSSSIIPNNNQNLENQLKSNISKFDQALNKIKSLEKDLNEKGVLNQQLQKENHDLNEAIKKIRESERLLGNEKRGLNEQISNLRNQNADLQQRLAAAEKRVEENRKSTENNRIRSKVKSDDFSSMNLDGKREYLIQNNYQGIKRDVNEKKLCIDGIYLSNDSVYIFVCNVQSRL